MIGYASRTGTRSTLAALANAGWRLLVSAAGVHSNEGMPYAVDNGAWTSHQAGTLFDDIRFLRCLEKLGKHADFVVIPDIVMGGDASLELSFRWAARVLSMTDVGLLAVQDGHEAWQVAELLKPRLGLFVGGSTEWKIATTPMWAAIARERNAWCHVGRVNTARRIAMCGAAGVTSFDGTSVTRFPKTLDLLAKATEKATRQGGLAFGYEGVHTLTAQRAPGTTERAAIGCTRPMEPRTRDTQHSSVAPGACGRNQDTDP